MKDDDKRRGSSTGVIAAVITIVALIPPLYLLGVGPLAALMENSQVVEDSQVLRSVVIAFFTPAIMLYECEYAPWYESYIDWWIS